MTRMTPPSPCPSPGWPTSPKRPLSSPRILRTRPSSSRESSSSFPDLRGHRHRPRAGVGS
uniref:Uncharacterized protein n=1 Tax=Arundo donax TaxID=35708 RepID=A0A0A9B2A3_ARUDO